MAKDTASNDFYFEGFANPTTTPVPDVVFDRFLAKLGEAELKALLYIIRRTFGFKRTRDHISFNQFIRGITTRDGRVLDQGCGIRDRTTLSKALRSLEEKGIVRSEKGIDEKGENVTTVYSLRFKDDGDNQVVGNSYHRGMDRPLPVVGNSYPQQTVFRQTDKQQSNDRYASQSQENVDNSEDQSTLEATEASSLRPVPPGVREERGDGFTTVGDVVAQKIFRPHQDMSEARQVILEYISDFSLEMGDEAKLSASVTRAVNLYRRSGRELGEFTSALYEARSRTKEYTGNVKKRKASPDGQYAGKNKMPYFFSVLEEVLGLKEDDAENGSVASPRPEKPGMGGRRPRKPRVDHDISPP